MEEKNTVGGCNVREKGIAVVFMKSVRLPEDSADIIRDFIGDCDREKSLVLGA